jgi:hypothetical protein
MNVIVYSKTTAETIENNVNKIENECGVTGKMLKTEGTAV